VPTQEHYADCAGCTGHPTDFSFDVGLRHH
jgi:hypothetical protein